ncbi:MAG: hypothetical protein M3P00_13265 [Gemmatimonadota bacterium]|nr:hypothetical protein [Gemmatimonadota bacterium]
MMDESELRRGFERLRDADRDRVPGFAQTYERARARRRLRVPPRLRPIVIGAAAAVAILSFFQARGRSSTPSAATPAITTWSAPTDVLLDTPGSELFGAMPKLGASVLDTMIPTPSNKGT